MKKLLLLPLLSILMLGGCMNPNTPERFVNDEATVGTQEINYLESQGWVTDYDGVNYYDITLTEDGNGWGPTHQVYQHRVKARLIWTKKDNPPLDNQPVDRVK